MSDIDLESALSQFYEDESLTDALTDQPAQTLLKWGEGQLQTLAQKASDPDEFDQQFTQLRKLVKGVSRFVAEHQNMAIDEQQASVEKIVGLAETIGLAMNNLAARIIEEQQALSDNDAMTHFIAQFGGVMTAIPIPAPAPVPNSAEIPPAILDAPVEDITEILPKGSLLDFIHKITGAVNEAKDKLEESSDKDDDSNV